MFQQNSERDVRTVNGLQKKFRLHKHFCMVTMLDLTQHFFHLPPGRSIKIMKPRSTNYSMVNKYSIGDCVRKAINKGAFSKSYKFKNFSEKLYEIIDTVHTRPPMYCLKDLRTGNVLDGAVYQEQIQRVRDDT